MFLIIYKGYSWLQYFFSPVTAETRIVTGFFGCRLQVTAKFPLLLNNKVNIYSNSIYINMGKVAIHL